MIILALLLLLCGPLFCSVNAEKVLVIVDDMDVKRTHATYFKALGRNGMDFTFVTATDDALQLSSYGEYLFDHAMIFAPKIASLGGSVDPAHLLAFVDAGHSLVVVASEAPGRVTSKLCSQLGISFGPQVVDFQRADHLPLGVVISDPDFVPPSSMRVFGSDKPLGGFLFRGSALDMSPHASLLAPLMRASASAYTAVPGESAATGSKLLGGHGITLMASLSARNGARVLVSGSMDMFSNQLLDLSEDSAARVEALVKATEWTFGRRGVLRARDVSHRQLDDKAKGLDRGHYRVGQEIEYSVVVEEWDGHAQEWVPFVADDIQLEFTMLDPHVRQFLVHKGKGLYTLQFKLPDVYGVFTFRTVYTRPGFTSLITESRVPVRPLRHDEYERFIVAAYPYYASSLSMVAGLFVFSIVFLYHKEETKQD